MTTLFGIKNCDTVKKARRWLESQSIEYQFHDLRLDGINAEQISQWIEVLGVETLINKRSTTWKALSEAEKQSLTADSAVGLIIDNPTLIKRPLLDINNQQKELHVGFKETTYQDIFK